MRLTDLSGTHAPPMARAMFASLRAVVRVARGEDLTDELRGLRPMWRLDGALAVHAAAQEVRLATQRGDVAAAAGVLRPRRQGHRRHLAPVVRRPGADRRARPRDDRGRDPQGPRGRPRALLELASRLHDEGHTVLERYADPSKSWGPEGRAWLARLDAELIRVRWLAGADDAPTLEALLSGWREVVELFVQFGDVYELARAQVVLASVLRAAGEAAEARQVGDEARETARRLGATPLVEQLRAIGSAPAATRRAPTCSRRGRPRSSSTSRPAGPTARSASSSSSAPRR
jgi:hypothetical protein